MCETGVQYFSGSNSKRSPSLYPPIMSRINPFHSFVPYFSKIHCNRLFTSRSSKYYLPLSFTPEVLYGFLTSSFVLHVPSISSVSYHPDNLRRRLQIMKLLIMWISRPPVTLSFFRPNIPLITLFSKTLNLYSSLILWNHLFYQYETR
jgi:hypothetical protein